MEGEDWGGRRGLLLYLGWRKDFYIWGEIIPIAGRLTEAPSPGLCLVGHFIFNCSVVGVGGHHSNNYFQC